MSTASITIGGATVSGSAIIKGDSKNGPTTAVASGSSLVFSGGASSGTITFSGATVSGSATINGGMGNANVTLSGSGNKITFSGALSSGSITLASTAPPFICPLGNYACSGSPASCSKPQACAMLTTCQPGYTFNAGYCTAAASCPAGGTFNPAMDKCENVPIQNLPGGGFQPLSFSYDAVGNITAKSAGPTTFTYQYHATKKHAVTGITVNGTSYAFQYDPNGNMTSGYDLSDLANVGSRQLTYNADNMPVQIVYTKGGVTKTTNFLYDETGQRIKKYGGTGTTYYIGDHYEVINGAVVKHVFAGNLRIAKVTATGTNYFHKDHLSSSTVMTHAAGNIVESTDYLPFGGQRLHSGTVVSNYKFTDQEFDPETGLYYYGARYYDPTIGRFISADTIVPDFSDPQMLNRYTYARNNPVMYTDPNGHNPVVFIAAMVIGAVAGGVQAAINHTSILEGMFAGAVIGGLTYGFGPILGGIIAAAYSGGDMGQGALMGLVGALVGMGVGGVLTGGIPSSVPDIIVHMAASGVTGGIMAELSGAKFSEGMIPAMIAAGLNYGAGKVAKEIQKANAQKGITLQVPRKAPSLAIDMQLRHYEPASDWTNPDNMVVDSDGAIMPNQARNQAFKDMVAALKFSACGVWEISKDVAVWVGKHALLNFGSLGLEALRMPIVVEAIYTGAKLSYVGYHTFSHAQDMALDIGRRIDNCKRAYGIAGY